jgi:chromosome segregation ATPase
MRLLFSGRYAKLEAMNRILTDAARKRTERIEQLEQELEPARTAIQRAKELEVVATQRAHLLNQKDEELKVVREALTKCTLRVQELEHTVAELKNRSG